MACLIVAREPNCNKLGKINEHTEMLSISGKAHVYSLSLPPSLASQTIKRRLTITLAWFTPISLTNQQYRTSHLWFEGNNSIANTRMDSEWRTVQKGTLQHEVFEDSNASAFIDGDSINIKVNCRKDANSFTDNIPYGIIVSLEVVEWIYLFIYQLIKYDVLISVAIG